MAYSMYLKADMKPDFTKAFAEALLPFTVDDKGAITMKSGAGLAAWSADQLMTVNPVGIAQAKDILVDYTNACDPVADDLQGAFLALVFEIAHKTGLMPELRSVDIRNFNRLSQWLDAPGALKNTFTEHAVESLKKAREVLGLNPS